MTTSAVIDRLVHHSSILELNTESYRIATAKGKKLTIKSVRQNSTSLIDNMVLRQEVIQQSVRK